MYYCTFFNYNDGSSSKEYIYQRNIQGDIIGIFDEKGNQVGGYTYEGYGNHTITLDVDGIASLNPYRYRGYFYDNETHLYYLNSRYYDSETGRFISPDTLSILDQTLSQINGLNLYLYCNDNPVMFVDPSGKIAISTIILLVCIGIGAVAGFGGAVYIDYKDDGQIFNGSVAWYDYLGATVLGGVIGGLVGYSLAPIITGLLTSTGVVGGGLALAGSLGSIGGTIAISTVGQLALAGTIVSVGALSATASTMMFYDGKWPGDDPTKAPDGFEWRGNGAPGSSKGNWYNPDTGEILHPDLNHPQPIGPHWDFRDILRKWWRIFRNGKFPK